MNIALVAEILGHSDPKTATNMAYMLSAQLAAMELNVEGGFVDGSALVYAPGTNGANGLGFATVHDLMSEANAELTLHRRRWRVIPGELIRKHSRTLWTMRTTTRRLSRARLVRSHSRRRTGQYRKKAGSNHKVAARFFQ